MGTVTSILLRKIRPAEYPELLPLWERSVRATHHFLQEADIVFYRNLIAGKKLFAQVDITVAADDDDNILGFLGLSDGFVEMLFIDPVHRRRGVGSLLLRHAIRLGSRRVDVNEDNLQAVGFYLSNGFREVSRSPVDGMGKAYPIIHMELAYAGQS